MSVQYLLLWYTHSPLQRAPGWVQDLGHTWGRQGLWSCIASITSITNILSLLTPWQVLNPDPLNANWSSAGHTYSVPWGDFPISRPAVPCNTRCYAKRGWSPHVQTLCNIPVLLTELLVNQRLEESRHWSLQSQGNLISTMNAPDAQRPTEDSQSSTSWTRSFSTPMSGRILNFLTLCHQHTTQVSIWLCMCERGCEHVSGWQASQYPSLRVCVKGCDLLGKEDSGSGPCQTEYPPLIQSPSEHYQWGPLSLCLVLHWVCVNTSSPSSTPALHRKREIRRRERGTSYTLGGRRDGGRALGHVWTWHTHIYTLIHWSDGTTKV